MKITEAVKALEYHKVWTKSLNVPMQNPKILMVAIDTILAHHQQTDTILESLIDKFKQRAEIGQKKYNTTLDRTDLTLLDWVNHAQEEAMDLSLYLEKIKTMLNDK